MTPMTSSTALAQLYAPTRRELPGSLKAILLVKVVACLVVLGVTFILFLGLSSVTEPLSSTAAVRMHVMSNLLSLAAGAALLELFGIAGIWSFKRWGVYMLACFTMLGFVFSLKLGNVGFGTCIDVVTTLVAAGAIGARWRDFE